MNDAIVVWLALVGFGVVVIGVGFLITSIYDYVVDNRSTGSSYNHKCTFRKLQTKLDIKTKKQKE